MIKYLTLHRVSYNNTKLIKIIKSPNANQDTSKPNIDMTFQDLYNEERAKSEALTKFIDDVAAITRKHRVTVKRWASGEEPIVPDALTQKVLADHFNTTPEELFPPKNK